TAGYFWFTFQESNPPPSVENSVSYSNDTYGFKVSLPQNWKEYTVIAGTWKGDSVSQTGQVQQGVVQGPMISIRNPLWTNQTPYQDIPVMIFTQTQWSNLQQDKFHIGAAPINPSQLGMNNAYVFALPARYNYAYPAGWQEVDQILQGKPLQTFNVVPANTGVTLSLG